MDNKVIFVCKYFEYKTEINNMPMAPVDRDVSGIFLASSRYYGQDLKCICRFCIERKDHRPLVLAAFEISQRTRQNLRIV